MPTNTGVFVAQLRAERAAVVAQLASIDVAAEEALFNAARAAFEPAQRAYNRASDRYSVINEKQGRLEFLDAQFATLGVTP